MHIIIMFLFLIQVGIAFPMHRQTNRIMYGPARLIPLDPDLYPDAPRIRADAPPAPPARPQERSNEPILDNSDSERD
jgi:hypothetical protein